MGLFKVKLYNDWRYYQSGETIDVTKDVARALISQNIGEYLRPKNESIEKEIKEAPKDKMLKGAPKSK